MKNKNKNVKKTPQETYFQKLLRGYLSDEFEAEQIECELGRLSSRRESILRNEEYTDVQKENLRKVIDNVRDELAKSQERLFSARREAEDIVSRLPSSYATILRMRYFLGMSWSKIEWEMYKLDESYTRSKVFKMHSRALKLGDGIITTKNSNVHKI